MQIQLANAPFNSKKYSHLGYTFLKTSIIYVFNYQIILLFPASVPYLAKDDSVLQGKGSFDPFGIFFNIICYRLDYICQVIPICRNHLLQKDERISIVLLLSSSEQT